MIRIKGVTHVAIAVKDLNGAVENWKRLFGIKPFQRGEEPDEGWAWVTAQIGNTRGDRETTIEFLSPLNDPNGEKMIGKFIKKRGEGVYMITLATEGTPEELDVELRETGIEPSWGGKQYQWADGLEARGIKSGTERYINPKDANGVLVTLQSIEYADPEIITLPPGKAIYPKK